MSFIWISIYCDAFPGLNAYIDEWVSSRCPGDILSEDKVGDLSANINHIKRIVNETLTNKASGLEDICRMIKRQTDVSLGY